MSEMLPGMSGMLASVTEADIRIAATVVTDDKRPLVEARTLMADSHGSLCNLLLSAQNELMTHIDVEIAGSYSTGGFTAFQLMHEVAQHAGSSLPPEIIPEERDLYAALELNYIGVEELMEQQASEIEIAVRMREPDCDEIGLLTNYRYLERNHPQYAAQGVRFATEMLLYPVAFFDGYIRNGYVDAEISDPDDVRALDMFFHYLSGYTTTTIAMLTLEDKTQFRGMFEQFE